MLPKRPPAGSGIVINIPGVNASTRVGDLTLEQLVLVIHSVISQTATRPRAFSTGELKEASKQIASLIGPRKGAATTALQRGIANMQASILKQMPDIARDVAAQATTKRARVKRQTRAK